SLFGLANVNSLDDGIRYLQAALNYTPTPAQPLDSRGKFGFCESFMALRNAARAQFIVNYLDARGIAYQRLPIGDTGFDNIWVPFAAQGPFTIFSAHYDKFFDDPLYQGASDNSAAVCILLVAAQALNQETPPRPVAILFTGEEEAGLVGAQAFYEYATQNNVRVSEVINLDSMGRGGLAARASGEHSGFVFAIPFSGEFVYDGRNLARASAAPALAARRAGDALGPHGGEIGRNLVSNAGLECGESHGGRYFLFGTNVAYLRRPRRIVGARPF
ncbi:MAG: hypothetical protein DCC52_16690, partial [Chloroflexi bacterium]